MAHALDGSAPAILRNSELDAEAVRAAIPRQPLGQLAETGMGPRLAGRAGAPQ